MKSFKEKMKALNIKQDTEWETEAIQRRETRWRLYAAAIAGRISAIIDHDDELNQSRLAEALNVSRQQISKILNAKENLTLDTICKLSEALGVELITFPPYEDLQPLEKGKTIKVPKKDKAK
jgi:transcriptional regulator with XRE-family HTH domain